MRTSLTARSKMMRYSHVVLCVFLLHSAVAVKVKVAMHSEQDDSKIEDEDFPHTESWDHKKKETVTTMPFIKHQSHKHQVEEKTEYEEEKPTTEKQPQQDQLHPNELIFPLIYRQHHVNSMFKFGENWYTWSTEKRNDGSRAINYYVCYDEQPKHCDEVGWERTDSIPKCAFQIDSLLSDDRACINSFGQEPHANSGTCDGAEQMKVSEMVRSCGPRIRSLWRFVRIGRRPSNVAKPADVNSLVCEDEEECHITIEYRIHHDRITFSLHEPTRGQTFKSALKRDTVPEEPNTEVPTNHIRVRKTKKREPFQTQDTETHNKPVAQKFRTKKRNGKVVEGKGLVKERNDSSYKRSPKNRIKVKEDVSEDISE